MIAGLRSLFLRLARVMDLAADATSPSGTASGNGEDETQKQGRVAYRLGHEAALAWTAGEYAKLEAFRNRAAMFLSAAVIAVAAGIGVTGAGGPHAALDRGCVTWIGLSVAGVGLAMCLAGAIGLMRRFEGPFVLKPKVLVTNYGDRPDKYPTDDATFRALALWGQDQCSELTEDVKKRCRWLNLSMWGLPVALVGVVLVWLDAL